MTVNAELSETGNEGRRLARSSMALTVISLLNMGAGLSWDVAIAAKFGISSRSDAFYLAYTLPSMITSSIYLACSFIIVPTVVREIAGGSRDNAWRLFSILLNLIFVLSIGLGLVGAVASFWIIRGLGPGLNDRATDMATGMSVILFLSLPVAIAFEVVRTGLYACRRYVVPTALDLVGNLLVTAFIVAVGGRMGISAAAAGIAVAKAIQLAIIVPMLWAQPGFKYHRSLNMAFPGVKEACRAFVSPLSGIGLRRSTGLVERVLASMLPAGSITALNYGGKLGTSVATAFYSSLTTALLPPLAAHLKLNQPKKVLENLMAGIKLVTFVSVPAVLLIVVLREPLVATLFQRGQVDEQALGLIASVVAIYSVSLLFMGPNRVLQNFFFADAAPHIVTRIYLLNAVSNVTFDLVLVQFWQAQGIAAATIVNTALAAVVGFFLLKRRLGVFPWSQLAAFLARTSAAGLASLGALLLAQRAGVIDWGFSSDALTNLYNLGVGSAIGGVVYIAVVAASERSLLVALRQSRRPGARTARGTVAILDGIADDATSAGVQPAAAFTGDRLPVWARRQLGALGGIVQRLDVADVQFWLWGGWAVDFRAGRVTRKHGDIDLLIKASDRNVVRSLLEQAGFWLASETENRFLMRDGMRPTRRPTFPARLNRWRGLAPEWLLRLYLKFSYGRGSVKVDCLLIGQDGSDIYAPGHRYEQWPPDAFPEEPVAFHGITCLVVSASTLKRFKVQPHRQVNGIWPRVRRAGGIIDRADLKVLGKILADAHDSGDGTSAAGGAAGPDVEQWGLSQPTDSSRTDR